MFLDLLLEDSICSVFAFCIAFGIVFVVSFAFVFFMILLWFSSICFALQGFHTTQYL